MTTNRVIYLVIFLLITSSASLVDWWPVSRYLRRRTSLVTLVSRLTNYGKAILVRWWRWGPLALGVYLGLRILGPLSTPVLVFLGWYAGAFWERLKGEKKGRGDMLGLAQTIRLFRSRYELQPNLWAALEIAAPRFPEPFRTQGAEAVNALYAGVPPEDAFPLLAGESHYGQQWAILLRQAGKADRGAVMKALDRLAERIEDWCRITEETETALLEVTGQSLVVVGAALGLLLVIGHVEALRAAYTESIAGQIRFTVLLTISAMSTVWIFKRAEALVVRWL